MPGQQAKHWCWTLNNYTDEEEAALQALGEELPEIKYLVFGKETGENGTPHLQGFISFTGRKTLGYVKRLISDRSHQEVARGSPKQAADYCKKDGDFSEYGELPKGQGGRSDLEAVAKKIKEGASFRTIAEEHPQVVLRYGSGVLRLKQHFRPKRTGPPEIWVLWGKTGTGKSRRVWEFANLEELWVHPGDRWFDGYDGHKAVLFDDFDGGWFKITYLLKLIDRYAFTVPVKGGFSWWVPSIIYFTTNIHPRDWYPNALEEHKRALLRRLTEFGTIQECIGY
jgi:hypothetical protein